MAKKSVSARVMPVIPKSYYSPSELDALPSEVRQGYFVWPRKAKVASGTVSLMIEISTSGKVTVLAVRSASDSALISAAKTLAKTSRYTPPRKQGKAVKARFSKTYRLIKPR